MENDRIYAVAPKLFDYVKSPSLRHIRDPHSIQKLAKEIVQAVDRAGSTRLCYMPATGDLNQ